MLARSAIQLQASKLAQTFLALVASVVLARGAGPAALGGYATLIAFAVLMQGLTSFGFEDLVLARGPLAGCDTDAARSLYRRVLLIRVGVTIVLAAVAAAAATSLIPDPFAHTSALAFGLVIGYGALNSVATLGAAVQAARVRPLSSAVLDTTWSLGVTATYTVLLAVHSLTLTTALATIAGWQAVVDVGYAAIFLGMVFHTGGGAGGAPFRARESAGFWLNGLLSIGVGKNSDVLAMNVAGAPSASVGRYSAAYNANLTAASILVQGTGTMLYVGLGRVLADGSRERVAAAWRTTAVLGALLSVPILLYCVIFPRSVLIAVYGSRYAAAGSALAVLAGTGVLVRWLGGGSNQALLFLTRRQHQVLIVRGVCVAINVALDILFYDLFGIVGVAAASGGSGLLITLIEFLLCRRLAAPRVPVGAMLRMTVPYIVSGSLARLAFGDGGHVWSMLASVCVFLAATPLLALTRPLLASEVPDSAPGPLRRLLLQLTVRQPALPAL
jgi:O-antigen/teichoic acid export membrane protein